MVTVATRAAFASAFARSKPTFLEPLVRVDVETPEESLGVVIGDLSSRRGTVMGTEECTKGRRVVAQCPASLMLDYATSLQALTAGTGTFSVDFACYATAPAHVTAIVNAETKQT